WREPAGRRARATRCCCRPRARATTCSRITRSGERRSADWWRPCERSRYTTHDRLRSVVRDLRWETRLLALVAAILVVVGLAVVVWTAMLAAKKGERIRTFKYGLLPFIVVLAPLLALIFFEPNLSMALLVALLAGVVLFTAGARIGHFLALTLAATPLLFGAV